MIGGDVTEAVEDEGLGRHRVNCLFLCSREKEIKDWKVCFSSSPVWSPFMLSLCKFPEVVVSKKKFIRGNLNQPLRNWELALPVSERDLSVRFRFVWIFRF
jgi:hypothetical protein